MKIKSITGLILALLIFFTSLSLLPQETAAAKETLLIQNGDFEQLENGWPTGWSRCCRPTDPHSALETVMVRSGKYAVRVMAEESVLPYVVQNVSGIMPGATYEASVWANVHLTSAGSGAFFKVECHGKNGLIRDFSSENRTGDTDGVFEKHVFQFTVPENTISINILCRFNGTGHVIFDDAELVKLRDPEKFSFGFGDVFHYPHEEKGYAWVDLASVYKGMAVEEEAMVDFELRDGEKVLHRTSGVHFTSLRAEYTYDISLLKEKKKAYSIYATAKWNGEEKYFSQNVYVYDRPTIIGDDGVIRINGAVFSPIMGYHIKDFTWNTVSAGGINVVQFGMGGYTEADMWECDRVLDILDENGMKALFVLYKNMKPAAHPDNIAFTKAYVNRFKDDPRIFAWAVMDEPFTVNATDEMQALIEESYTLIRNIDSMHPVHIADTYSETTKYCDMHSIDYYSVAEDNQVVYDFITATTGKTTGECYVQYVGRTFTYGNDPKTVPSTKTVRGYVYRAFEAGAKGIGYFSVSDAVSYTDSNGKTVEIPLYTLEYEDGFSWSDFSRLNQDEVPTLHAIYVQNKYTLLNEYVGGKAEDGPYWGTWTDGKVVYLIVHNKTSRTRRIKPSFSSANGLVSVEKGTIEKIGGIAPISAFTAETAFSMGPYEAALYKITPEDKIDLTKLEKKNLLPNPGFEKVTVGTPDGWNFGGDSTFRGVVSDATQAHEEENYVRLALGNCRINTYIPVRGNTAYRLGVYYRASCENAGVFGTEYYVEDIPYKTYLADNSLPSCTNIEGFGAYFGSKDEEPTWKKAEFQFTTPEHADRMRVQFSNNAGINDAAFVIDTVTLIETDDLPNLLPNGSFSCFTDKTQGKAASWLWNSPEQTDGVNTAQIFTDEDGTILPKGESCLKIVADSERKTEFFPYAEFYLLPGSYTLSFRYRHEAAQNDNHAAVIELGEPITYACPTEAGKWHDYSYTFTVASGTAKNTLRIPGPGRISGTYYFDDFVLLPAKTDISLYAPYIGSDDKTVLKAQGTKISSILDAESINGEKTTTVRALYTPITNADEEVILFICVYAKMDGRKELVSLSEPVRGTSSGGKPCAVSRTVPMPGNAADYSVEAFLWSSSQGMKLNPMLNKKTF